MQQSDKCSYFCCSYSLLYIVGVCKAWHCLIASFYYILGPTTYRYMLWQNTCVWTPNLKCLGLGRASTCVAADAILCCILIVKITYFGAEFLKHVRRLTCFYRSCRSRSKLRIQFQTPLQSRLNLTIILILYIHSVHCLKPVMYNVANYCHFLKCRLSQVHIVLKLSAAKVNGTSELMTFLLRANR